jgi:DNA-binding response OmpR family regulator
VPTVLLIDDSEPMRLLCRVNLELEGFRVREAAEGHAGIDAAREEPPDAILLDLMLPTIDGWEVLDELQSDPRTADVPVVVLSGVGSLDLRREGLELGAVATVLKPFDPTVLPELLRETIARAAAGETAALREEALARLEAERAER